MCTKKFQVTFISGFTHRRDHPLPEADIGVLHQNSKVTLQFWNLDVQHFQLLLAYLKDLTVFDRLNIVVRGFLYKKTVYIPNPPSFRCNLSDMELAGFVYRIHGKATLTNEGGPAKNITRPDKVFLLPNSPRFKEGSKESHFIAGEGNVPFKALR